ncbi:MAG: alpha/beta hydrolase family protein [bacterium]
MDRRRFIETSGLAATAVAIGLHANETSLAANTGENKMPRFLDSEDYTRFRIAQAKPPAAFTTTSLDQAQIWQKRMSNRLIRLLGGFPEKVALEPETVEQQEFERYTREKVYFESRAHLTVKAYLLLPKEFKTPGRCMICLPGHGRGVDDIVGIQEDGTMRTAYGGYQNDFALQCVDRGIAAFAVEQFAFGDRRSERARKDSADASSCNPTSGIAFMLGETMVGWRVWDVIRSIDYLETRKEIDPKRIGAMGISGGGTTTFWSACVEPRIKVAFASGYFCTFDHCIMAVPHCVDNYIPGIYRVADMPEFAGLIAPRPFFVESGTEDNIFLLDGVKAAVVRAKEIYKVFGAEDRVDSEHFEAGHSFHGKKGFPFVEKWL